MFEIKKSTFGWTVYLNGLSLRVFATEDLAAGYIAQVRTGDYTSGAATNSGAQ